MKHPATFKTRVAANKVAAELRKTYIGVVVCGKEPKLVIAYDEKQLKANLKKRK